MDAYSTQGQWAGRLGRLIALVAVAGVLSGLGCAAKTGECVETVKVERVCNYEGAVLGPIDGAD